MLNLFKIRNSGMRVLTGIFCAIGLAACDANFDIASAGGGKLNTKGPVEVALLVPYGSSTAGDDGIARELENAARLAIADLGGDLINLRVYPTGGNPNEAARVADLAAANGAQVILGPLRSDTSNAAAHAVADDGLNVISFSNNASIAGDNLFVLGTTFEDIAHRLLGYAGRQGRTRAVVVSPNSSVGQIARNAIVKGSAGTGVQIVGDETFEFSQEGIVRAVPRIASTVKSSGATAIFLTANSSGALPLLAQLLPEAGVSPANTKYLGLTRWNIPQKTLSLPGLQGGWFTLPDTAAANAFKAKFSAKYAHAPHTLAPLAYDGMAAIGALIAKKRNLSAGNLVNRSGFAGANGVFRFKDDRTTERALAVAQVTNSQVKIIDPAPKSFGARGF